MYRRTFNYSIAAGLLLPSLRISYAADHHTIEMLNTAPDHATGMPSTTDSHHQHHNAFFPDLLEIKPGDSVTFLPIDAGHNSAAKKGMVPEGAERWNSPMDKEFTVTLTIPGVYGYICLPHYDMGMVGMIVVREKITDPIPNLESAQKVRHPGSAKKAFRSLFERLQNQ